MPDAPAPAGESYRILFLCTGNTCRSPMAAAVARDALARRGWRHVEVRSAGVAALPGAPASDQAVGAASERDLDLSDHRASQLDEDGVRWADLVLCMSPSHVRVAEQLGGEGKTALVTDFLAGEGRGGPVVDPFGADLTTYRTTLHQLAAAVEAVLDGLEPLVAP